MWLDNPSATEVLWAERGRVRKVFTKRHESIMFGRRRKVGKAKRGAPVRRVWAGYFHRVYASIRETLAWVDAHRFSLLFAALAAGLTLLFVVSTQFHRGMLTRSETEALLDLAKLFESLEQYDRATELYGELLRGMANAPFARLAYADVLFKSGEYAKAEVQYRHLTHRLALKGGRVILNRVMQPLASGDVVVFEAGGSRVLYKAARIRSVDEAISPVPAYNLGQALLRQGKTNDAQRCFQLVVEKYEQTAPTVAERARLALDFVDGPRVGVSSSGDKSNSG